MAAQHYLVDAIVECDVQFAIALGDLLLQEGMVRAGDGQQYRLGNVAGCIQLVKNFVDAQDVLDQFRVIGHRDHLRSQQRGVLAGRVPDHGIGPYAQVLDQRIERLVGAENRLRARVHVV